MARDPIRDPMSEAEIRDATVGGPTVHDGPIVLAEADAAWPARFEHEAGRIRRALHDRVVRLEHVGSTSVPDLAAKPIIDIALAVADSADEPSYVPPLEGIGFVLRIREPDLNEHRMLVGPDGDINLHVFTVGDPELDRMVALRDRLRRDDEARTRYERTKRELAARRWRYVQNYADAKSGVIEEILSG